MSLTRRGLFSTLLKFLQTAFFCFFVIKLLFLQNSVKSSKFLNKDLGFFKEPSESRQSFLTSLQMICLRILQIISVLLIHPQLVADLADIRL